MCETAEKGYPVRKAVLNLSNLKSFKGGKGGLPKHNPYRSPRSIYHTLFFTTI